MAAAPATMAGQSSDSQSDSLKELGQQQDHTNASNRSKRKLHQAEVLLRQAAKKLKKLQELSHGRLTIKGVRLAMEKAEEQTRLNDQVWQLIRQAKQVNIQPSPELQ